MKENDELNLLRGLLLDAWFQFAYDYITMDKEKIWYHGGLSTLEDIFDYLLKCRLINEKGQKTTHKNETPKTD